MKGLKRTHRCTEISTANIGENVTLMGWVQKSRNKGGIIFVDLRDRSGIVQLIFENGSIDEKGFEKATKLRSEFVIAVTGVVEARSGAVNNNLKTGEIEVRANSLRILAEAETPPFPIEENSKTKEDLRLKYRFVWITEFPLLEWSDEENRFKAMHHPFTMPMEEDLQYIDSDPGRVRAKAYDIVLNGTEIGGGSVRIHQNDIQEKMFEVLGFTKEKAYEQFGFLLTAFKYGVPPHAGLAYGLDRLVMLMAKQESIRDVIAFPKVKDASCLMTEAPNLVDEKQLEELGIAIRSEE